MHNLVGVVMQRVLGFAFSSVALISIVAACSAKNTLTVDAGSGSQVTCASEAAKPSLTKNGYAACTPCQPPALTPPLACSAAKPINACCDYVQAPGVETTRATGLHYFSSNNTTLDLGCLDTPAAQGTSQTVTITGFVKLFSSGNDSSGVKIEMYREGPNGALGALVGAAVVTKDTDPVLTPQPTWSTKCPTDGCKFRQFTYANVPTETPLIVRTSDANNAQKWSEIYDYNLYFANDKIGQNGAPAGQIYYEPSAVAATDINTVASAAGGFTIKPDKGVIAGEVHDCGDVRLSGAMVNTDYRPEGDMFYFGDNEADPLPDISRAGQNLGTSKLGLFGALNYQTGVPIRISAVGKVQGQNVLLGTYVVQVFPGAVTALSLRGRRPFQK